MQTEATIGVWTQCWNCTKWEREMISSIITSSEKMNTAISTVWKTENGRSGAKTEETSCRGTMLKLCQVRARNDLKHHHELGKNESGDMNSVKKGERPKWHANRDDYWGRKMGKKNNFEKMMQWSDHCEGLVVLVPMVETVRKTDFVWVQNGQTRKGSTGYK